MKQNMNSGLSLLGVEPRFDPFDSCASRLRRGVKNAAETVEKMGILLQRRRFAAVWKLS